MASINLGFRDQRNSVELALAPGRPLSVSVIASGNLPLGKFGSALKVASAGLAAASAVSESVGMIKSVATMAPASFTSFKLQLQSQAQNKALSATLTSSLDAFNTARVSGTLSVGGTIPGTSISVGGTFDVNNLLQLSGVGSGVASAAAVAGQLAVRAAQLAALTDSISNAVSAVKFFGTTIKENFNKQANPTDDDLDKPSTPAIARGGADAAKDTAKKTKASLLARGAKAAVGAPKSWVRNIGSLKEPLRSFKLTPGFSSALNMTFASDNASQSAFTEPNSAYKTQWPWNQATITESGHMFELDDTPGGQRVHLYHRAGSFIEMHPDGKVVYKATNDQYSITLADQYVQVKGKCLVSVDGDASIYAKGDVQVQSDENIKINAKKNFEVYADNISLRAKNKSTVDGTSIDLRYVQLPGAPVITPSGLAPRMSVGALKTDYPDAMVKMAAQIAIDQTLNKLFVKKVKTQLATAITAPQVALASRDMMRILEYTQLGSFSKGIKWPALRQPKTTAPLPKTNPLMNPLVYQAKSQDAQAYRGRMFDTPEETAEMELYQAHVDTRRSLNDLPTQSQVPVPGNRTTPTNLRPEPEELRRVVYLNRSAYTNSVIDPSVLLGTSSFTLGDVVDVFRAPDVANFISPPVVLTDKFVAPTVGEIELPSPTPVPNNPNNPTPPGTPSPTSTPTSSSTPAPNPCFNGIAGGWNFLGYCSSGCTPAPNGCGEYEDEISCLRKNGCLNNE